MERNEGNLHTKHGLVPVFQNCILKKFSKYRKVKQVPVELSEVKCVRANGKC